MTEKSQVINLFGLRDQLMKKICKNQFRTLSLCLLFLLTLSISAVWGAPERAFLYDAGQGMLELGALGTGNESYALDVNDSGQVTGFSNLTRDGATVHAFLWVNNINGGTMTDLNTLGGVHSIGRAINSTGSIVGESQITASQNYHAFIWNSTSGIRDIGTLGGTTSKAYDINTAGTVVGYSTTATGATHAFIWTNSGGIRDIGTLTGGTESYAYGINDAGLVVGYSNRTGSANTFYLFTWDSTNAANPLVDRNIIVGERLKNAGINATGQIGGHYLLPNSTNSHGFFYNGTLTDIGVLTVNGKIDEKSLAFAINNSGQVAGYSAPSNHGVVWDSTNGLVDFSAPYLGTTDRCFAFSINNLGQIVGGKTPNTPPDPPVFTYPTNGATNVPLTPTLTTGPFHDADTDPVDTHGKTRWQISRASFPATTPPAAADLALDITSSVHLTSLTVPASILSPNTVYYLRACFYDSRGARSNWSSVVSFTTVNSGDDLLPGTGNGVPDSQDVNATIDMDANGTPDINQTDLRAVNTVLDNAQIAIKHLANVTAITRLQSIDPATITDMVNRPQMMPLGLINFRLAVTTPGATARITVYLSSPAPTNEWYKYDTINGWQNYSAHAIYANNSQLTVELQDGGFGDADGVANGVIVDPSGFGFAASPHPPDAPVLVAPANAATNIPLAPTLQTGPYNDPDGDAQLRTEWQISTSSTFSTLTYSIVSRTALTSLTVPNGVLSSDTTYYWRARFFDIFYAASAWSPTFSFTTLNLPPTAPTLISPANGANNISRIPTLSTGPYSDPENNPHTQTQWQISTDINFATLFLNLTSTTDLTSHTIPSAALLARNTLHYWRVRFYDDHGNFSDWSTAFSFITTPNTIPDQPVLSTPANTATDVSLTPTLQSSAFADLDSDSHAQTQWQVSTAADFATITYNVVSSANLTSLTLPDSILNTSTTYYWRVRYYDNYVPAGESAWSAPFSFSTTGVTDDANGNGIPDAQEVSASTDLDGNGTPDINQADIKSVNTLVGGGSIGVKISTGVTAITAARSVDPATITDTVGRPEVMPLGLIRFTVNVNPGSTGTVLIYHTDPAPLPTWYTYDAVSGWQNLSAQASFSANRKVVTLTIQDGGPGDADGIANGTIVSTGGFGFPASPHAPDIPVLTSPTNGAINIPLAPTLQTSTFVDQDSDSHFRTEWQVSSDSGFATLIYSVISETNLTSLTLPNGTLSSTSTYYWRVRFTDYYYAVSSWSATSSFTTLNLSPNAPTLTAPTDTATEVNRIPTLTVNGAIGYYSDPEGNPHTQTQWQLSTAIDFAVPAYDLTSNTDLTSHTLPLASILARTTLFYYRARFYDSQGSISDWSPVFSFTTTANTPPNQPSLAAPLNLADNVSLAPQLETGAFADVDGDSFYMAQWQISSDSGFTNIVYNETGSLNNPPRIILPDLVLNGSTLYHWRARHYDNYTPNGVSAWSTAFTFTTSPPTGDVNTNGIPDTQEVQAYVDMDANGTPDINQTDIKSVNTLVGNGRIGVKAGSGVTGITVTKSVDPATITDTLNRPEIMPLGLIGFKVNVASPGATGTIVVYLSDPAPLTSWYYYTADIGWLDNTSQAAFSANRKIVTLTIQDGERGDADHTANGVIVHLGGFGFPASNPPNQPTLLQPANASTGEALTPTLSASAFVDPDSNSHYKSQWQVATVSDFSAIVLNVSSTSQLTQLVVPEAVLNQNTTYYWRVCYTDNYFAVSPWANAFSFTTQTTNDDLNANGIPDLQELDPAVDMDVDLDNNGTADLGQADIKCLQSLIATFGNEMIGVKRTASVTDIVRINSIDPATITDTSGRPERLPFGLISMKLAVATAGQNGQVVVYFSDPAPPTARWYGYDSAGGWRDMSYCAAFSGDRKSMTLTVQDGGYGDQDGTANGLLIVTGGFGFPASLHPPNAPTISAPADGATGQALALTLQTSAFSDSDAGDTHFKTAWEISTASDFSSYVLIRVTPALTALPIPYGMLAANTTYYWRVQFYDNYYTASPLSSIVSFTTGTDPNDTNSNGIPDSQEVGASVDLDANGTPDNVQTDLKAVNTVIGSGQMGIKTSTNVTSIDAIQSVDPAVLPDGGDGKPTSMPLGILDFRITVANPGDTAQVIVYFSQPAPAAQWYKYDPINSWQDFSNHAVFAGDMRSVTLTLKDGAFGDADGVINGIIIDPSGSGKFIDNTPRPAPATGGGSGGGCFIDSMMN